jgi:hypothetical protein
MTVTTAPVSKSLEKVLFPTLTISGGLISYPLKGVIISKSSVQVAIEIVHKRKISCGMMLGVGMMGFH